MANGSASRRLVKKDTFEQNMNKPFLLIESADCFLDLSKQQTGIRIDILIFQLLRCDGRQFNYTLAHTVNYFFFYPPLLVSQYLVEDNNSYPFSALHAS